MPSPYLSVVIPCYNEQKNLEHGALAEVRDYLARQSYLWEVLIVDDGSTDFSRDVIERFLRQTSQHPAVVAGQGTFNLYPIVHGTKPAAIREGIDRAQGEWLLFSDMDQSTPIAELEKLLPWARDHDYEVVIGSRGSSREGFSILRQAGSAAFRLIRSAFLLRDIKDTQCGFKLFRRDVAVRLFPRLQFFHRPAGPDVKGWKVTAYDVELLHLCRLAGYRIKEVDVVWRNRDISDTKGQSGEASRYIRESVDMARQVFRVMTNQLKGLYRDL